MIPQRLRREMERIHDGALGKTIGAPGHQSDARNAFILSVR